MDGESHQEKSFSFQYLNANCNRHPKYNHNLLGVGKNQKVWMHFPISKFVNTLSLCVM